MFKKIVSIYTSEVNGMRRPGIFIDPVSWNIVFRPMASAVGGVLCTIAVYLLSKISGWLLLGFTPISFWWCCFLGAIFGFWAYLGEDEEGEEVPYNHAAAVTIAGMMTGIYRTTKDYSWTGKRLFLGRLNRVLAPATNAEGFIFLGDMQVRIWNESNEEGEKNNIVLSNVGKNTADVKSTLTIEIQLLHIKRWLNMENPILSLADRARSAYRTAISFFVDRDSAAIKDAYGELMTGDVMITAFINKQSGVHPTGSIVRDDADTAMYEVIDRRKNDESEVDFSTRVLAAKQAFQSRLQTSAEKDMLTKVRKEASGLPVVKDLKISKSLNEVLDAVGVVLKRSSVADIVMSDKVRQEANNASSEADQRSARIASAESIRDSRKKLILTKKQRENPSYADATMIAAAQDDENNSIKVVHVTGGGANPLTQAATVLGSQLSGGNS